MKENQPDHHRKLENDNFFKECMSPKNVELRIGAQVCMFVFYMYVYIYALYIYIYIYIHICFIYIYIYIYIYTTYIHTGYADYEP